MATDRLGRVPTIVLALLVPAIALVTVVVTLNVTDDGSVAATGGGGSGVAGDAVSIKNFQFSPSPLVVKAGAAVTVTNDDGTVHTLTADDGTFDTGNLDGGAKKTVTIDAPGTYAYHCNIHTYMTGTIEAK